MRKFLIGAFLISLSVSYDISKGKHGDWLPTFIFGLETLLAVILLVVVYILLSPSKKKSKVRRKQRSDRKSKRKQTKEQKYLMYIIFALLWLVIFSFICAYFISRGKVV